MKNKQTEPTIGLQAENVNKQRKLPHLRKINGKTRKIGHSICCFDVIEAYMCQLRKHHHASIFFLSPANS